MSAPQTYLTYNFSDDLRKAPSFRKIAGSAWPALLITVLMLLPYINKAFLIDDPHFLLMSQQILSHPLRPMNFEECWNSPLTCDKAFVLTVGNTLMGYVLVPTVLIGMSEEVAHITQILFACTTILLMTSLMLRLGWNTGESRLGTALLAALPPFLPMASTAMPDLLALSMTLLGIERLTAWKQDRRWYQGVAAAAGLALAGIARMHLALIVPLALFLVLDLSSPQNLFVEIRKKAIVLLPVVGGGLILAGIVGIMSERSLGNSVPSKFSGIHHIPHNFVAYLLYLSWPLPFTVSWLAARGYQQKYILGGLSVLLILASILTGKPALLAMVGALALADLFLEVVRYRNPEVVGLALWIMVPIPIVYYGHMPIKYLLPCMPAIILLCMRWWKTLPSRFFRLAAYTTLVFGLVYSGLILHADKEYADFPRNALRELVPPHVAAGDNVWVSGHYHSYFYAVRWGAKIIGQNGAMPKVGDFIVQGGRERGRLDEFPNRRLVQTISYRYSFGRTMYEGKGLYTNHEGFLLWGFGNSANDDVELWRLE